MAFQADGELVWIHTEKHRYLAAATLRDIEQKLKGGSFRRVHRRVLVNLDHVRKMAALSSQRWLLTMKNGAEFSSVEALSPAACVAFLDWTRA